MCPFLRDLTYGVTFASQIALMDSHRVNDANRKKNGRKDICVMIRKVGVSAVPHGR
jgi:hypothetical protein